MYTVGRKAAMRAVEKLAEKCPQSLSVLYKMTKLLNQRREWPESFVHVLVQQPREYDVPDSLVFDRLNRLIYTGSIAVTQIYIGRTPSGDKRTSANNAVLSAIPSPFEAEFAGGPDGGCDGYLEIAQPVHGVVLQNNGTESAFVLLPCQRLPLEVGYTQAYVTYEHLFSEGGVARWPYGQDRITILTRTFQGRGDPDFDTLRCCVDRLRRSF